MAWILQVEDNGQLTSAKASTPFLFAAEKNLIACIRNLRMGNCLCCGL
jgi:hypothetical protein